MARLINHIAHNLNQKYADACINYGEPLKIKTPWYTPRLISPRREGQLESFPGQFFNSISNGEKIFTAIKRYCNEADRSIFEFFVFDIPTTLFLIGSSEVNKKKEKRKKIH